MSTLIKNAEIITMEADMGILKGSILIEEGKVSRIFPHEKEESSPNIDASEVIDAGWDIIIPGMTNAHYHSYSNLLKGTENNFPLEIWSLYTIAYGHSLTDEDIYLAVLLGASEMIRSGITGCIDHFPHLPRMDAALRAYEESEMQVSFAPMMQDITDEEFLDISFPDYILDKLEIKEPWSTDEWRAFFSEVTQKWHTKNGKIHLMLGPNAPQRCSGELLGLCKELSDQFDLKVHTHLLETKIQEQVGRTTYNNGLFGRLDELGLLNSKLSVAHAVWLTETEIDQLKNNRVAVIHNPASNMILGSGVAPVSDYIKKKIRVGIGTDASNCGTTHNHFEMMRLAAMLPRIHTPDYKKWPKAQDVFEMATVSGAEMVGYENLRGKIAEGYDADIVFLSRRSPTFASAHDLISQIVFHENGQSVDSVMIKGKWVLRNREILAFDEQKVLNRVQERFDSLKENSREAVHRAEKLKPYFENNYWNFQK
ncbi:amidohydrolase family protein [Halobacillus naozhouensis]|uniref:Amidohydrolase family protein n=1 Tax=Halobacillus naozhouensis TaxID=554880 RepID=A0ABY8IY97_9BACI|nr:amidohydrolase family protein [Halobacillus naozhouensis]WFT74269.1 amidohydrolase family protein [Halobacillus naozhouensis]